MRDARFAHAACNALAKLPGTLVQSHERIACCDIYRAGDGVHAVWVAERMNAASAAERIALAAFGQQDPLKTVWDTKEERAATAVA